MWEVKIGEWGKSGTNWANENEYKKNWEDGGLRMKILLKSLNSQRYLHNIQPKNSTNNPAKTQSIYSWILILYNTIKYKDHIVQLLVPFEKSLPKDYLIL